MADLYRPMWPGLIGHQWATAHLARVLNVGRLRHAYLLSGTAGIGKTAFARTFAQAVNCTHPDQRPCGQCRACTLIGRDAHVDVSLADAPKIEDVRGMIKSLYLRPVEAQNRVLILRRLEQSVPATMDALLKTLEEPPGHVILLITTENLGRLLPTIRSRCQHMPLRPLPADEVRQALHGYLNIPEDQAALLANLSGGRIGWAARAVSDPALLEIRNKAITCLEEALAGNRNQRFAAVGKLLPGRKNPELAEMLEIVEWWQTYFRDLLLIGENVPLGVLNRDRQVALRQIAQEVGKEACVAAIKALRQAAFYLGRNVTPRLVIDNLFLELPRARRFRPTS
jgi:DNA polymerase III subunit delta'